MCSEVYYLNQALNKKPFSNRDGPASNNQLIFNKPVKGAICKIYIGTIRDGIHLTAKVHLISFFNLIHYVIYGICG